MISVFHTLFFLIEQIIRSTLHILSNSRLFLFGIASLLFKCKHRIIFRNVSGSLYQLFSVNGNIGISEDHYNRNKSSRLTNISDVESIFTGIFGTK